MPSILNKYKKFLQNDEQRIVVSETTDTNISNLAIRINIILSRCIL